MENQFKLLNISEPIIKGIDEMGFKEPTIVQEKAIPVIMDRKDVIVRSKTGSGKTGAFGIPILQLIKEDEIALILTPTRELAIQIDQDIRAMKKYLDMSMTVVYGQHNMNKEIEALKDARLIVGTPGRVWDHVQQGNIHLNKLKYIVLDEADRMLDMGFFDQVIRIVKKTPKERMTLLFSATMPPEISNMAKHYMKTPTIIEIESDTKTVDTIKQIHYRVKRDEKNTVLDRLLRIEQPDSCMVFCNTRNAVDRVDTFLHRRGYHSDALHGANSQSARTRTLQHFKKGDNQILVATDVAARGLHVEDLSLVINYDVPLEKDSYIHRIGRTGRAGNGGRAITFVTSDDLMTFYEIEEHVGVLIDEEAQPTEEMAKEAYLASDSKWKNKPKPKPKQKKVEHGSKDGRRRSDDIRKTGDVRRSTDKKHKVDGASPEHKRKTSDNRKVTDKKKVIVPKEARPHNKVAKSVDASATKPTSARTSAPKASASKTHVPKSNLAPKGSPLKKTVENEKGKYRVHVSSTKAHVEKLQEKEVAKKMKQEGQPLKDQPANKGVFSKIKRLFKG